jgi:lipopolysaccharide transport system permease protein
MAKRDIKDQYVGRGLGAVWAVIQPIFLIAVYLTAFMYIFKIRLTGAAGEVKPMDDLALYVISGVVPFLACQTVLTKSTTILTANAALVKQVVFPIEVLPVKIMASALLMQAVCTLILLGYMLYFFRMIPAAGLLLPVIIIIQYLFLAGCSLLLSVLAPFLRDINELVSMICTVLLYATPIFYNMNMLPEALRPVILLNPFTHLLNCYRDIFYDAAIVHGASWLIMAALAFAALGVGVRIFAKLKTLLGNVL